MRFRCYLLCLILILLGSSASQAQWEMTITAVGTPGSMARVIFGLHPEATDGFDGLLIEAYAPPLGFPPMPIYAAFQIPVPPNILMKDMREVSDTEEWDLGVRSDLADITLTWDNSFPDVPPNKSFSLQLLDVTGNPEGDPVDMRAKKTISVEHKPGVTRVLKLKMTTQTTERHTVTAGLVGGGGTITPAEIEVVDGWKAEFTLTPDDNCHVLSDLELSGSGSVLADVNIDKETGIGKYTLENITKDQQLAVYFALLGPYIVSVTSGEGGTITPPEDVKVDCRTDQTFTIAPDPCYHTVDVLVNGESVGVVSEHTFASVTADHAIEAIFALDTYTITAKSGDNGAISPSGDVGVNCGAKQVFTITPDPCYHIADILIDGESADIATEYTFSNIAADHTIDVVFAVDTYSVTVVSGNHGSISPSSPSDTVEVNCGADQTFTINPNSKYHVEDVMINGASAGPITKYTFENVTSDQRIEALFVPDNHTIIATAFGNGSIEPSGELLVPHGSDKTFIITPEPGYGILDLLVDAKPVGALAEYTLENITANHIVTATFTPDCVKGDVNGDGKVRSNDAIWALRISAQLVVPTPLQQCAADMNGDGKVRSNDVIIILQKAAGLID